MQNIQPDSRQVSLRSAFVDGLALWAPAQTAEAGAARPAPKSLAANERRRAPDSVLIALQVAEDAVAMSGHDPGSLASVFTSAHGDLPIVDALCKTLAEAPALLSPTRFHHSVHNAPSGYWGIASGSRAPSTALAACAQSFAAGLLEALVQLQADGQPVLLAGCDTEAVGALASVNRSRGLLGAALVLAPKRSAASRFALRWGIRPRADRAPAASSPSTLAPHLQANALADALPLMEALLRGLPATLALACGNAVELALDIEPVDPPDA
jgi:hypothetical protein